MRKLAYILIPVLLMSPLLLIWFAPGIIPGGAALRQRIQGNLPGGGGPGDLDIQVQEGEGEGGGEDVEKRERQVAPVETFSQRMQGTRRNLQEVRNTGKELSLTLRELGNSIIIAGIPIGAIVGGLLAIPLGVGLLYIFAKWGVSLLKKFGEFLAENLFSFEALKWIGAILVVIYVAAAGWEMYSMARARGALTILPQLQKTAAVIGFVLLGVMWKGFLEDFDPRAIDFFDLILKGVATVFIGGINATALAGVSLANWFLGGFAKIPIVGGFASALITKQIIGQITAPDIANAVVLGVVFAATLALARGEDD